MSNNQRTICLRRKKEILELIKELEKSSESLELNTHKYIDKDVPSQMIQENQYRIHTLEWVLGEHDRFD